MAAYAAVVSLMNTTDAITNHPRLSPCLDKEQVQSLSKTLSLLLDYIENHTSHGYDQEAECLQLKIASAAHAAEDVIESHIVDQIQDGVLEKAPTFFIDLQKIIQGMDLQKITVSILEEKVIESIDKPMVIQSVTSENNPSCLPLRKLHLSNKFNHIKGKVMKLKEKMGSKNLEKQPINSTPAPSEPAITTKATMVGFDDYLNQLLDDLSCHDSRRKVIPIVGMGGIGKTTLARNAYENLLSVHHFDVRAWVSISQQYSVRKILVELLSSLGQFTDGMDGKLEEDNEGELCERLYKFLCGRRYLVILDDMWSFTVWEEIMFSFPENHNDSRIVITTRLLELANDFGSPRALAIDLLDDGTSWDLFLVNAFTQESCPSELEQIGKSIVKKCKGLPLSIVVIGALLGKSRMQEYWENIVENISSILNSTQDNQLLDVLCLSYNHLPARLKPCFLYLGMFPEDYEISVSRLIKLWIAEGFIKPDKDKSLEEVAEGYISDLLSRNLILLGRLGWNRRCETFYIRDLLRDLCLREAEKEKFFCITKNVESPQDIGREDRRVVIRQGTVCHTLSSTSMVRSLICEGGQPIIESKLLRVLVADHRNKNYDPAVAFEQVNMRLLAYECARRNKYTFDKFNQSWLKSRFMLWNLQTLIFTQRTKVNAPNQIWMHRQLRHIEFWLIRFPLYSSSLVQEDMVLHNLQT